MTLLRRVGRAGALASVLIIAGVLLLSDVAVTLAWQEPVTAVVAMLKRDHLNRRYLSARGLVLGAGEQASLARLAGTDERVAFLAHREQREVPNGAAIGRLVIPRLGVAYDVVQGTSSGDLELGPGHYPASAFPGLGGTVAIAGHRTTYLAPFRNINRLRPGDRITLRMPYATFVYVVQWQRIVSPRAWWITRDVGYERLVLSSCNPLYSAAQRIAVFARLVTMHPGRIVLASSVAEA